MAVFCVALRCIFVFFFFYEVSSFRAENYDKRQVFTNPKISCVPPKRCEKPKCPAKCVIRKFFRHGESNSAECKECPTCMENCPTKCPAQTCPPLKCPSECQVEHEVAPGCPACPKCDIKCKAHFLTEQNLAAKAGHVKLGEEKTEVQPGEESSAESEKEDGAGAPETMSKAEPVSAEEGEGIAEPAEAGNPVGIGEALENQGAMSGAGAPPPNAEAATGKAGQTTEEIDETVPPSKLSKEENIMKKVTLKKEKVAAKAKAAAVEKISKEKALPKETAAAIIAKEAIVKDSEITKEAIASNEILAKTAIQLPEGSVAMPKVGAAQIPSEEGGPAQPAPLTESPATKIIQSKEDLIISKIQNNLNELKALLGQERTATSPDEKVVPSPTMDKMERQREENLVKQFENRVGIQLIPDPMTKFYHKKGNTHS